MNSDYIQEELFSDDEMGVEDDEIFSFTYVGPSGTIEVNQSYGDTTLFDPYGVLYQFERFLKGVGYGSDIQVLVNGEPVLEK